MEAPLGKNFFEPDKLEWLLHAEGGMRQLFRLQEYVVWRVRKQYGGKMTEKKVHIHFGEAKVVDEGLELDLPPEMIDHMASHLTEEDKESAHLEAESFETFEELEARLKELYKKGITPALFFPERKKKSKPEK